MATVLESRPTAAEPTAAPAARPLLEVQGLSKFFGVRDPATGAKSRTIVALDGIDASVRRGELISLLGPSGCGKTTLLRIAAGLTGWDEGTVTIDGTTVAGPRKDACMVFQHFGLLPWRTVMANVEFPLELDGMPVAERRERAAELLNVVGLHKYHGHLPHELSGGMQQRVGIARALMRKPLLLFMDEPFGALDAQTREKLQDDFLKIWASVGTTVLFVTHSIDEALVLSDRIFVFTPGPGRIKAVIDSPLAAERIGGDVRTHAAYGKCRHELRELLNENAEVPHA